MKGKPGTYSPRKKDGYVVVVINGVRKLQHVWIWEKARGPVPRGHHLHHKNGVRHDNRLSNLEAIKPLDHRRLHCGYKKDRKGRWLKPCCTCKKLLPMETHFYQHFRYKPSPQHECKECCLLSNKLRKNKKKFETARAQIQILTRKIKERAHGR